MPGIELTAPIRQNAVSDELFAGAYESLDDWQRGWLKKCVAQLYTWYHSPPKDCSAYECVWKTGFFSLSSCRPRQWAMILVHQEVPSPAQVLAAAFPPLMAGIDELFVVIVNHNEYVNYGTLTGLELSGIENVFHCSPKETTRFLESLISTQEPGLVVSLGADCFFSGDLRSFIFSSNIRFVHLRPPERVGLWIEETQDWHFEILKFIYPGLLFEVWGQINISPPPDWSLATGDWSQFLAEGYDLLYVPSNCVREALSYAPMVLGPGQESCWLWPGFPVDVCYRCKVALSDKGLDSS